MAPGDFVRNCKQLIDLLRQIEEVADPGVAAVIRDGSRRGRRTASSATRACRYDEQSMSIVTSPFGPFAVLLDPRAGDATPPRTSRARTRGRRSGLPAPGREPSAELTRLSGAALDEGYRFVAAVGNDGTVQDVVNGMFRDGRPIVSEPVLGVVAAGGCDLSLSFGLPRDVAGAVGHLAGENTYPFDVMKIAVTGPDGEREIRYAHNVAEVGFHAAATIAAGTRRTAHEPPPFPRVLACVRAHRARRR